MSEFKYEYVKQYLDLSYYTNIYTNTRIKLHNDIIDKYFINIDNLINQKKQKFIFTSGAYGSGKSFFVEQLNKFGKINLKKYIYVDPDEIRKELPEYNQIINNEPLNLGILTNQESFFIGEIIRLHAMFLGMDVIYDSSLKNFDWIENHIRWIRNTFVSCEIIIIHIQSDLTNILERNLLRAKETKRCISPNSIRHSYFDSIKTFDNINNIVDKSIIIPNILDVDYVNYIKNTDFII